MILTPDWITAISTVILLISTMIYVFFTYKLTKETVKLREVETTPFISLHIDSDIGSLKVIVKNIGKAPAYNISFSMDKKYESYFHCGCNFKDKISYFAPNQQIIFLLDSFQKLNNVDFENIPIHVQYYTKDKVLIKDIFLLEWKYLSGSMIDTNNVKGIKSALEDITKELKELNKISKDKEYIVTNKLKILELEKTEFSLNFIFSNGYVGKINFLQMSKLKLKNINSIYLQKGDLYDDSTRMKFSAEEIYYKLKKIDKANP